MKHLFLIRHAKSSWADESLADRERPLNNRGIQQLGPMGRAIRAEGALEGPVFCSPALRARQTMEGLAPEHLLENACVDSSLYTFNHEVLVEWLRAREDDDKTLTIIGHNPALLDLAGFLLKHPPEQLPTCGFMHISVAVKHWRKLGSNKGRLEQFLTPKHVSYRQFGRKRKKAPTDKDAPLGQNIPLALQHQYQRVRELEPGVIRGYDHEFLHQYRIAIRRSRAIAESVSEIVRDKTLRKAIKKLKKHAQATSRLRDLHVFMENLAAWQQHEDRQVALASSTVVPIVEREAEQEHRALVKRLRSKKCDGDMDDWHRFVLSRHLEKETRKLHADDIRAALCKRIHRYNLLARKLGAQSDDADYHRQRKLLKRIRYLAELDKSRFRNTLRQLKKRQQRFGDFQDLHMQIDQLMALRETITQEVGRQIPPEGLDQLITELVSEKTAARDDILDFGEIAEIPV